MKTTYTIALGLILLFASCTKYLDAVPDSRLTIPRTVSDFEQLLDNEKMFNNAPGAGELGTDDIFIPDDVLATQSIEFQKGYIYSKDIFSGLTNANWNNPYEKVYYANVVLDGIDQLKKSGASVNEVNLIRGWALFCRANAFYDLQEVFGQPYRPSSASSDLGIPLKLSTDLSEKVSRATVEATYGQIVDDLEEAVLLLPDQVSKTNRSKPSKPAAYALLARVYLMMQNYGQSLRCATNSLDLYKTLLDYNTVNTTARLSFSAPLVDEILYNSIQLGYLARYWEVDRDLYASYAANDLRKVLFYAPDATGKIILFKGFYSGNYTAYNGLTTDEVYLTRAECYARTSQDQKALDDLNTLLVKRYKTGSYIPYGLNNTTDVLSLVLTERRKECIFRNLRWSDLRRLNQDSRFAKTVTHISNGITYQLPPNDPKYVFPIPDDEIRATRIEQNIR